MDKYAIYKVGLTSKQRRGDMLMDGNVDIDKISLEDRFERLFGKKQGSEFMVKKFKKKNDAESYPCIVLRHDSNIILLRIQNPKDVDIWEEQPTRSDIPKIEKTKKQSSPYCYVIIDNRPGRQLMAIQTNNPAWRSPNQVRALLEESINWQLHVKDYGLEVNIKSKMLPTNFWDYVDKKRKKDHVTIKNMVFSFTNHRRRPDIDIKSALSSEWRHFESFIGWMDSLGGENGEIRITPPKNDALLTRKKADIKHMIEICLNSNYSLSVTFSDNITYKCNEELRAELPMEKDSYRTEFEQGYKLLFKDYSICEWLDKIYNETKKYKDVEEIKPKPGRRNKEKQVG